MRSPSAGNTFAIASGKYVVPEGVTTAGTNRHAERRLQGGGVGDGDTIFGVLFDNTGAYSIGSSVTTGPDQLGGTWTYTVTSLGTADAAHQDASYSGFVYDTSYFDTDRQTSYDTFYGLKGFSTGVNDRTANYSGNAGLGSDGDLIQINGTFFAIASGKYVVPENIPGQVVAGQGAPVGGGDGTTSANLALLNNVTAASFVAPGVVGGSLSSGDPSSSPMLLATPHG